MENIQKAIMFKLLVAALMIFLGRRVYLYVWFGSKHDCKTWIACEAFFKTQKNYDPT